MPSTPTRYTDPRAHELRNHFHEIFRGDEIPVPVESIAEDLLGLRIREAELGDCSGMLFPSERLILVNAAEAKTGDVPIRRQRFTIAHELGHWICHARGMGTAPTYCRAQDISQDTDRTLEREANVFGAELLMPEAAVREAWENVNTASAVPSMREDVVRNIASGFDVSTSAMWYRLYSLALVPTKPDIGGPT